MFIALSVVLERMRFERQTDRQTDRRRDHATRLCCSSGAGASGVFIALSVVLERMRFEGVVDVFQTVNILRTQRPDIVHTEVLAKFLHFSDFRFITGCAVAPATC